MQLTVKSVELSLNFKKESVICSLILQVPNDLEKVADQWVNDCFINRSVQVPTFIHPLGIKKFLIDNTEQNEKNENQCMILLPPF